MTPPPPLRSHTIQVSLSDEELDDLLSISNLSGLDPAEVVATTFYISTAMLGKSGFGEHYRQLKSFADQRSLACG